MSEETYLDADDDEGGCVAVDILKDKPVKAESPLPTFPEGWDAGLSPSEQEEVLVASACLDNVRKTHPEAVRIACAHILWDGKGNTYSPGPPPVPPVDEPPDQVVVLAQALLTQAGMLKGYAEELLELADGGLVSLPNLIQQLTAGKTNKRDTCNP